MKMISPTITGETAIGRSTSALSAPTPGKRWRTIRSAQRIPNTVFSGTAIDATRSVSLSACSASGFVTSCQGGPKPRENVRSATSATGRSSSTAREASATERSETLAIMLCHQPAQPADAEKHAERDPEQHERHGRRTGRIVVLHLPEDVDGSRLGLEGDVPRDEDDGAELSDRAREGERDAGEDRGRQGRQDDPPHRGRARGAER